MSIYFDSKIVIPESTNFGLGKRIFLDVDWHPKYPLLAIAHSDEKHGGLVSIYDQSKDETTNTESTPQSGVQITGLCWHPVGKILAIAYETGEVVIWNHDDGEVFEGSRSHNSAVMLIEWSHDGSLLVSSDNMGILIIWKSDSQGHLQTQAIHDFKDPVCQIVFRQRIQQPERENDEADRNLGMMTTWRPKTGRNRARDKKLSLKLDDEMAEDKCFFVGVLSGTIYYLKESGSSEEVLSSGSTIRSLLYYKPKDILIVMTEAQIMGQFHVESNGDLKEINKMKLSGNGEMRLFWVGTRTLAVIGKDPYVRLWDVESGSNTVIEPRSSEVSEDETFLSIDYHFKDGMLCCCSNKGKLVMWKETEAPYNDNGDSKHTEDDHWEPFGVTLVPSSSKAAKWCKNVSGLMAVNAIQDVIILREQELCYFFAQKVSVIQTQPNQLTVNMFTQKRTFDIKVDMQIKGMTASGTHVSIWNGLKALTYEFGPEVPSTYKYVGSFATKADTFVIQELSLYIQEIGQVQIRTFTGTIKQSLPFTGNEGPPITMAIGGDYFTCGTENGFIKVWHIGRREAKLHTPPKNLKDIVGDFGEIINANTNFDGTKVGFVIAKINLIPDSRFFVLDLTNQSLQSILFPGKFIEKFFWELDNDSYVAVEVRSISKELVQDSFEESVERLTDEAKAKNITEIGSMESIQSSATTASMPSQSKSFKRDRLIGKYVKEEVADLAREVDHAVITMFADSSKGFLVHEKRTELNGKSLVGLEIPYLYMAENGMWKQKKPMLKYTKDVSKNKEATLPPPTLKIKVDKELIQEFEGVEDEGGEGRTAMLKYVHHTLFNDMDGALRAIKTLKNVKIYSNMVRNCVKTQRMDVAMLCLAKMRDPRMAMEVRTAMETEPEKEAHVAMLAIQLGMPDEAIRLYEQCKRYDLLLELYILQQSWDNAIKLCEKHRRIQLRTTYHAYAKQLETERKFSEAIEMYEKAETHRYEVPRMLVDSPDQLQSYVVKKKDKELYQWWAQYLESSGDVESALRYYELALDWLSLVRLLCFLGNYDKAVEMAEKAEDKASAYHLARTLEDKGEVNTAIDFYSRAGAYGHAIRMCKDNSMAEDLWKMAQMAAPSEKADAAKYFETAEPPLFDKAIQLYHQAGYDSKALDLAFSAQEYSALQLIVRDILNRPNMNTDPQLLQKCADFFVQNQEIDKAIDMLCAAQKYTEAMDLCVKHNFTISDDLAERLTVPKGIGLDEQTRVRLLEKMGESCTFQGSYHLAAKKFTQAGNKIQAMKSLLKSGDTERIMFYANVSRHREIYMMAANYLQTTDWRKNSKIIQTVVNYYTKAQAMESLAGFYENIAESEIEDSRDYRSALEEYRKAEKCLSDLVTCGARQYEEKLKEVQTKMNYISKFLSVKENLRSNPTSAMSDLRKLIEDPKSEIGVRTGDIYGFIVEHYVNKGETREALTVLEEMRKFISHQNFNRYLSPETLSKIEKAFSNESIFRVKSSDSTRTTASHGDKKKGQIMPPNNKKAPAGNDLAFLNKDVDDALKEYQTATKKNNNVKDDDNSNDEASDEEEGEEEEVVEEEEVDELVEDEEIIEEEETDEEGEADQKVGVRRGFFSQT